MLPSTAGQDNQLRGTLAFVSRPFRGIIQQIQDRFWNRIPTTEVILVWWTGIVLPIRFYIPPTCILSRQMPISGTGMSMDINNFPYETLAVQLLFQPYLNPPMDTGGGPSNKAITALEGQGLSNILSANTRLY